MKINIFKRPIWLVIISSAALTAGALAAGGNPEAAGKPIRTQAEAKQLPTGSRVTLACAKCKTSLITEVDQKKSFLTWFAPKTKHECPGCGGYMTAFPIGNQAHGLYGRYYTHTCSICGDNSAACSANAPGHKTKS
jgi:hypothetical protein